VDSRELGAAAVAIGGAAFLAYGAATTLEVLAFHFGLNSSTQLSSNAGSFVLIDALDLAGSAAATVAGAAAMLTGIRAIGTSEGGSPLVGVLAALAGILGPTLAYSLTLGLAVLTYNQGFFSGVDTANSALSVAGSTLGIPFGLVIAGSIMIRQSKPEEAPSAEHGF